MVTVNYLINQGLLEVVTENDEYYLTEIPNLIASLASSHMLIEKSERDSDTISNIRAIDEKERVLEISRLIGGIDITENTIKQAVDMIEQGKFQFNEGEKKDE